MAPTKPLVAQQIEACYNIMGIPRDDTAEMTGTMNPTDRQKAWRDRRVFFLTPQRSQYGVVEGDFALAMSLYHGYELLQLHGLRSLYNFLQGVVSGDKAYGRTRTELMRNADFCTIMDILRDKFQPSIAGPDQKGTSSKPKGSFAVGHPKMVKLEQVVVDHFNKCQAEGHATRVMIFSQYRDSVQEITQMLQQHEPLVKVMSFIGQSSAGKATKGFTQKEQLKVMQAFRTGGYNTLVSTCVGEEGLDIGDVDLIVCFDAHKSPIRLVQRMGRTGRKRQGRIVMLVTEGKEEQIYNHSQYTKRSIHRSILNGAKSLIFYPSNPRMIPVNLTPACHRMHITVQQHQDKGKGAGKGRKSQGKISSLFSKAKSATKSLLDHVPEALDFEDDDILLAAHDDGSDFEESIIGRRNVKLKGRQLHSSESEDDRSPGAKVKFKVPDKQAKRKKAETATFNKKKKRKGGCAFLDNEAELSDDVDVSSDEAEDNLDQMEGSFIDNATQFTQASQTDIQALYLKSVRSPVSHGHAQGARFRLQYNHAARMDVFSQPPRPDEEESQYQEDSFCVGSEEEDEDEEEESYETGSEDDDDDFDLTALERQKPSTSKRKKKKQAVKQVQGRKRLILTSSNKGTTSQCKQTELGILQNNRLFCHKYF
nr:hypothetical protein BaRGS_007453 [Batillaria attramentaria]